MERRRSLSGKVHKDTLELYEQLGYREKALSITEELGNEKAIARCHNRVGRSLALIGRNDETISHFEPSIQILPHPDDLAADSQARIDKLRI